MDVINHQPAMPGTRAGRACLLAAVLILSAGPLPLAAAGPADFVLGIGDLVTVSVWGSEELSTTVPVRPDGNITVPLVGELHLAGMTPYDAREELNEAYSKFVSEPTVSLVVNEINSRKVFILGEVATPGVYDLVQPLKLVQALALAGGLTPFAKKDQIVVLRVENGIDRRRVYSLKDIISGVKSDDNIPLVPGDTIIVP